VSLIQINGSGNVSVHGCLDQATLSKDFWLAITEQERGQLSSTKRCSIDLSDVERIDTAGLAWLINAIRDGKQQGIDVSLQEMPEKLRKLAKISGVDSFLPVE
jgi:phospholipid transport system transporter-binding protein